MRMKTFFRAVTAFVALAILPFASVIAESGIETKSTCLSQACDKASHGALVETKSYVWKEPDFGGNGVELHGYKVGDVWWAPGWATNSGEGGQEPVKTVLTKMEYVPSTLWQGYMQWNVSVRYSPFQSDLTVRATASRRAWLLWPGGVGPPMLWG